MESVVSVILAADELVDPQAGAPLLHEPHALAELACQGCEVWLAGPIPGHLHLALQPWVEGGRVRRAEDLEQAARHCRGEGKAVMVVGARPSGSVRFANRLHFTSALIAGPDLGEAEQPDSVEELPDFVLGSLADVLPLVRRLEREEGDFEGTE